jgi:hypothetical protein
MSGDGSGARPLRGSVMEMIDGETPQFRWNVNDDGANLRPRGQTACNHRWSRIVCVLGATIARLGRHG